MADEIKATETVVENKQEVKTQEVKAEETWKDGEKYDAAKAQELIEKLRSENKAAKAAEKKLAEFEAAEQKRKEAEMSETERLKSQLAEKEAKLAEATRREMQRSAADKFKLPPEIASRLVGSTAEEMEADAEKLAKLLPKQNLTINPTNVANNNNQAETEAQKRDRLLGTGTNIWAAKT